ncbi:MAG: hypothetical protein HZC28_18940 [Spirochaetes bacterium]|nr:hypothetical protein [Spirochaetota bacterium]
MPGYYAFYGWYLRINICQVIAADKGACSLVRIKDGGYDMGGQTRERIAKLAASKINMYRYVIISVLFSINIFCNDIFSNYINNRPHTKFSLVGVEFYTAANYLNKREFKNNIFFNIDIGEVALGDILLPGLTVLRLAYDGQYSLNIIPVQVVFTVFTDPSMVYAANKVPTYCLNLVSEISLFNINFSNIDSKYIKQSIELALPFFSSYIDFKYYFRNELFINIGVKVHLGTYFTYLFI